MSLAFLRRTLSRKPVLPDVLDVDGRTVPLRVRVSPRARRMTLRADAALGCIGLTLPSGVSHRRAAAFLETQKPWIAACTGKWPAPRPFAPGVSIPCGDAEIRIEWRADLPRTARLEGELLLIGGPAEALPRRVETWLRREALRLLTEDCAALAAEIGLPPPPIRLGDTTGRWGSCSSQGALAFSWRLVMAPEFVRRAVAAHEVAHIVHHNHGPEFHALCSRLSGATARKATRWLATHGAALHWIGRR
ncbi:MAG: SprT family zinc-dependent metalloprotease [Pseudomonadota bacterium]|nr:SprT family zinc-dependent metalloprotease [Pseudomonadota bacterium]